MPNNHTAGFLLLLRDLCARMRHRDVAVYLGVPRSSMRNWLYRNRPPVFTVQTLLPRVEFKLDELRRLRGGGSKASKGRKPCRIVKN